MTSKHSAFRHSVIRAGSISDFHYTIIVAKRINNNNIMAIYIENLKMNK